MGAGVSVGKDAGEPVLGEGFRESSWLVGREGGMEDILRVVGSTFVVEVEVRVWELESDSSLGSASACEVLEVAAAAAAPPLPRPRPRAAPRAALGGILLI